MHSSILGSEEKQAEILDQILSIGRVAQQHIVERPKKVYQLLVEVICKMTGADCAVIYPYHPSFGEFYDIENVAACGLRHDLPVEKKADKRRRLAARVHREGEIIREDIEREEPQMLKESSFIAREDIQAFMGLSLRVGDNILGILYVDYRQPHSFSEGEKQIIRLIGQQAAMAISNSWSYRLADMRAEAVAKLKAVGQSLVAIEDSTQTLDSVLEGIAHSAQEVLDADIVDLYQYIQARNEFVLPPTQVGERLHPRLVPTRIYDDDVVVVAVRMGEPWYLYDAQTASLLTRDFEVPHDDAPDERFVVREKVASSAIIPLTAAAETVGVMFVNYRTPQFFGPEQKDVIESFAAQAAIAIYNARLFQQVSGQAQALAELNELAPQLVSIEESPQGTRKFLEEVASSAQEVLKADLIELYEYLQEQDEYRLPQISVGEMRRPLAPKDKVYADDAVFQLIHREEPLYVDRVQDSRTLSGPYTVERKGQPTERFVVREGIQSAAVIPLRTGTETVGLMFASYRTLQLFTKEQREIIELFANQAAIAIHNSRLFNALDRRLNALSALNEVGQTLTSGIRLKEDEILELIHAQASKLMPMENMYIALYDETTDTVRFGLAMDRGKRLPDEYFQPGSDSGWAPRSGGTGRTEEIIRTKGPIFHRTGAEGAAWYAQAGHEEYVGQIFGCWIGVPMIVGERVLGVIAAYHPDRDYVYDENDLQILTTLASQAAVALDNANLYYEVNQNLERRVDALSALNKVGQMLTSGIRLREREILELIHAQASKLMPMDNMYIALYDGLTDTVRFGLAMDRGKRLPDEYFQPGSDSGWAPRSGGTGRTEEVIRTKGPIFHRTRVEGEAWYAQAGHEEYVGQIFGSWIGVPMIVGEKVLGAIAAYDPDSEDVYDANDLRILTTLASQAAIALDNATLYYEINQDLERRVEALSVLNEVGQTLTAGIRLKEDEILNLIYEQARRLTDTQNIYIALYEEKTDTITFRLLMERGKRVEAERQKGFAQRKIDKAKRGKTEEIILTRKPILHRTRAEAVAWYNEPGHRQYSGEVSASHLAVPMVIAERVTGVIAIYDWEREYAYDEQDLQVLSSMASQAAIALDNANLYAATREELIAAKQLAALGTVTAAIQHRINNTLNIIVPNVTRLRKRVDTSDETIQEILDIIERNTQYTSDYIARIQEPLKETEVQAVDINACLREAQAQIWGQYQDRAGFGAVEVAYNLDDSLPLIEASLGQITEIFRNLIENGYKAMSPDGGNLTIGSRHVDGWLEVEIQDTGPGIPANIRDKLFVKPVPSRKPGEGSGLGLWLTNLLLQKYAGEISIEKTGVDGTTMLIRFPVSKS